MEGYGYSNKETISGLYSNELMEHMDDLRELGTTLAEDAANYRVKSK